MLHENLSINEKGNLCIAGVDTVELAKKYGGEEDSAFVNGVLGAVSRADKKAPDTEETV